MPARLDISPSLVQFLSPVGNGFQTAGKTLVDLGTQKVQDAKDEAAKNELLAKQQAQMNATASKNRALNPGAVNAINASYGITPDSPLANPNAPTQANKDIGLVDLGLPQKPMKANYDNFKTVDGNIVDVTNGKVVYKGDGAKTPNYRDKFVEFYTDAENNRVGLKGDGSKVVIGKAKDYNAKTSQIPENMTATTGLSPEALRWAYDNGLVSRFDKQTYISKDDYAKARNKALFGNEEVE